ncbi:hypothetical protein BCR44DRAFT_392535 [Catenaria anguillulae PL171]|uniref:Uncharacterized protein n=1 Tax=Catenaria anguillulae PL171 TaxID=765915 RepID=A0A1Y2H288_9FUNG|nr:hypothetical protein BCR44DRAFT_392535 [Catenaria anguillulae PL171]
MYTRHLTQYHHTRSHVTSCRSPTSRSRTPVPSVARMQTNRNRKFSHEQRLWIDDYFMKHSATYLHEAKKAFVEHWRKCHCRVKSLVHFAKRVQDDLEETGALRPPSAFLQLTQVHLGFAGTRSFAQASDRIGLLSRSRGTCVCPHAHRYHSINARAGRNRQYLAARAQSCRVPLACLAIWWCIHGSRNFCPSDFWPHPPCCACAHDARSSLGTSKHWAHQHHNSGHPLCCAVRAKQAQVQRL